MAGRMTDSQKFWSRWIITGVIFGIISAVSGFIFAEVTEIPKVYQTKEDAIRVKKEIRDEQKTIKRNMRDGFDKVLEKIDEIQIYLRDHQ